MHGFTRANKKVVRIEEILDPFAITYDSQILLYSAILSGIRESVDSTLNDVANLHLRFNKVIADEAILGCIKIVVKHLKTIKS